MIGKRVQPDLNGWFGDKLEPGEYVRVAPINDAHGKPLLEDWPWHSHYPQWLACAPNGHVANISKHTITEHADGTITVAPSILISDTKGVELWHGFLEAGVWRGVGAFA